MAPTLRVLVIEDHLPDAQLVVDCLKRAGFRCEWTRCETREAFLAALDAREVDLVLADFRLPAFSGLEALRLFNARALDAPFIFVSGAMDEETALECITEGAADYAFKDKLTHLGPIVERALRRADEARERRRHERSLSRRVRAQEGIVQLGRCALSSAGLGDLMQDATRLVARVLDVEYAEVIEPLPEQQGCVVRASEGWPADVGGAATIEPSVGTPAALALSVLDTVIVDTTQPLERFPNAQRLAARGIASGALVVIRGRDAPFGVLACYSASLRRFSSEDVLFLLEAANVLASGIERRQSESALSASREAFRALSLRLQSLREEERSRIAREVHDELGQTLTATKIEITRLQAAIGTELALSDLRSELRRGTAALLELTDETIASVRRIASELRPALLDLLGLEAAIDWQLRDFEQRTGVSTALAGGVSADIDGDLATACFRIVQEGLTNVTRHARARHVQVTLAVDDRSLTLSLVDDGVGIAPESAAGASLGLLGMRERATALGGTLDVARGSSGGTVLTVRLPVPGRGDAGSTALDDVGLT
jgi:two-component system, NarL family, sensor histidine kinase UhpB